MKNTNHPSSRATRRLLSFLTTSLALGAAFIFTQPFQAQASSHSDAPLIKLDPQANLTDVYAFIRNRPSDNVNVLVVEVSVRPFSEPGDGVMYESFSPDALYSIHITDPATGAEGQRYDFQFSAVEFGEGNYKNATTILRYGRGTAIGAISTVGDAQQNFTQTYNVSKTVGNTTTQLNSSTLMVPPPNVGKRTTPAYNDANGRAVSGATTPANLDSYTAQTVYNLPNGGVTVFAGPREDGFYADTPGIFDLLDPRILGSDGHGQTGNGVDGFKGYNVLHYAIEIPLTQLTPSAYNDAFTGAATGVGVYASVARPRVTLRQTNQKDTSSGPYIQVNRLANPLFNEVIVALQDKDNYNRRVPTDDPSMFAKYALNPELPVLINAVFGTNFVTTNRTDLVAVYSPDVIRVCTTTGPVPLIGQGGNRLSGIGGDTTAGKWSGWPNGRRFGDDVVDIALTAIASGPSYSSIFLLGDNINANDQTYNYVFPYAATPNAGPRNTKDSGPNVSTPSAKLRN